MSNKLDFDLGFLDNESKDEAKCNKCEAVINHNDKYCPKCGHKLEHVIAEKDWKYESSGFSSFYAISNTKLAVLSICTFGLYEIYWFYKQWKAIQQIKHLKIHPIGRSLFAPLFAYSLFKQIFELVKKVGEKSTLSAGWLAAGYIFLTILWRLPEKYWLVSLINFVVLIPIQNKINYLWQKENSGKEPSSKYNLKEGIILIIGGFIVIANLFV